MNKFFKSITLAVLCMFFTASAASAQEAVSNCVVTKIGGGLLNFVLPQECQQSSQPPGDGTVDPITGLIAHPTYSGYYKIPASKNGSYTVYSCNNHQWGSKSLIEVLVSVSNRWRQKYPQGFLYIGDLNAAGHASHNIGIANDLYAMTHPNECVANYDDNDRNRACGSRNYNRAATKELGKMFVDTNMVLNIWYNDQEVNNDVIAYARSTGKSPRLFNSPKNSPSRPGMRFQPNHANHFHLDISLDPTLKFWEPGC